MSTGTLPYVTRDVATEPPTTIVIVPCGGEPPELSNKEGGVFAVTEDCVEPTKGWLNREGKPLLTVCFMHSFGKCVGRTNFDPSTCFQIHIKATVLNALRRHYTHATRCFFTRTVKALLSPELRQLLRMRVHKDLKVQYLEYRVSDVFPSTGLVQYEAAYRRWLFSDDTNPDHASTITVLQCLQFSMTGACNCGTECSHIHADLKTAQVRDPMLARALRDVSDITHAQPATPIRVPRSLQSSNAQSFSSAENGHGSHADALYPSPLPNGIPLEPMHNFVTVPIFTIVQNEGGNGGRLVPLRIQPPSSDGRDASGYSNEPQHLQHVSFFSPEESPQKLSPIKSIPADGKKEKASSERQKNKCSSGGKADSGWVSSSNEGISSSNNQTSSSGSGSGSGSN